MVLIVRAYHQSNRIFQSQWIDETLACLCGNTIRQTSYLLLFGGLVKTCISRGRERQAEFDKRSAFWP